MSPSLVHRRWAFVVLVLAALVVLMVRNDGTGNSGAGQANAAAAPTRHSVG